MFGFIDCSLTAKEEEKWESNTEKSWYGLADAREMISEAFSNPEFQRWMSDRPPLLEVKAKSAWQEFKNIIKEYLGTPKTENALDQLIDLTHENLSKSKKFGDFTRVGEGSNVRIKDSSYQSYLNESAMEQASINPFFNLDNYIMTFIIGVGARHWVCYTINKFRNASGNIEKQIIFMKLIIFSTLSISSPPNHPKSHPPP